MIILDPIQLFAPPTFTFFALYLENHIFLRQFSHNDKKTVPFTFHNKKEHINILDFCRNSKKLFLGHFGPLP